MHNDKLSRQRDEAQKRKSGREFRWGAAVAKRKIEEEACELYDLERESDRARARRLRQFQYDWFFSARCGELDALLAVEAKRQALIDQEIADLERIGAHQQVELAKRREDVLFSERLGELDALISELEAELSFMQGQHDALYCSEEAVEIDCDVKRGEFLTVSTAYDETKRLKKEVARLRHAQKKRGYYGVNDQGWFIVCGNTQPEKEKHVRLGTYNKFDVLKCQPLPDSDEEADVPKKKEEKRRRRIRHKPREVDNFDELLAEAAKWDAECKKQGTYPPFINYISSLFERRREWALCLRDDIPVRHHTNNVVEAAFRVLKDSILHSAQEWAAFMCEAVVQDDTGERAAAAFQQRWGPLPTAGRQPALHQFGGPVEASGAPEAGVGAGPVAASGTLEAEASADRIIPLIMSWS
ncbi:hypothetical protein FJT64_007857 [Amphibalanus amphitrite]|uniref:Uncharacterized protein n=1 Tax=Amphibalanus amphitrite TaxID=1232801 RepID=A0A6A4VSB2_AMPAM|nr:hypothetical protein FJT64_007857 [Amphibalanus amphitrite]